LKLSDPVSKEVKSMVPEIKTFVESAASKSPEHHKVPISEHKASETSTTKANTGAHVNRNHPGFDKESASEKGFDDDFDRKEPKECHFEYALLDKEYTPRQTATTPLPTSEVMNKALLSAAAASAKSKAKEEAAKTEENPTKAKQLPAKVKRKPEAFNLDNDDEEKIVAPKLRTFDEEPKEPHEHRPIGETGWLPPRRKELSMDDDDCLLPNIEIEALSVISTQHSSPQKKTHSFEHDAEVVSFKKFRKNRVTKSGTLGYKEVECAVEPGIADMVRESNLKVEEALMRQAFGENLPDAGPSLDSFVHRTTRAVTSSSAKKRPTTKGAFSQSKKVTSVLDSSSEESESHHDESEASTSSPPSKKMKPTQTTKAITKRMKTVISDSDPEDVSEDDVLPQAITKKANTTSTTTKKGLLTFNSKTRK